MRLYVSKLEYPVEHLFEREYDWLTPNGLGPERWDKRRLSVFCQPEFLRTMNFTGEHCRLATGGRVNASRHT